MENKTNIQTTQFEICLLIIAILIPVFLESFPNLIDKIISFLPIYLKLDLISLVSIVLGTFWFLILLVGIIQFNSINRRIFNFLFFIGGWLTISLISLILFVYTTYLIALKTGSESLISLMLLAILLSIIFAVLIKSWKKRE